MAILVALLLLFSILFYTPLGNMIFSTLSGNVYPESSSFTLQRQINVDVLSGEISYTCEIPYPEDVFFLGDKAQDVTFVTPVNPGAIIDKYGSQWIQWSGTADHDFSLSVTYEATVETIVWDIEAKNSGMASDIPSSLVSSQAQDEWVIEDSEGNPIGEYKIWPSHPTIKDLARRLTSESRTVYENVNNIYKYIRKNIDYQTISGSEAKSCLQTLSDGRGDCDDQSILLISLCRSIGIPAWLAFGTLYDNVRDVWGPHAWAEVFIPLKDGGGEGVVIDPANGEFLVRNCNRLEEWKSDGVGEHLSDYYNLLSYNYTLADPHQPAPVVSIGETYSGEYKASAERIYAILKAERSMELLALKEL